MQPDLLHVVTAVANPLRWASRIRLYRDFAAHMLDAGVALTVVECAYGDRPFELDGDPHVRHVGVRARTLVWNKESLLNLGIARLPPDARFIGTFDADIRFRRPSWASDTLHALQVHPVVQPWTDAYDLGPDGEPMATHRSFASVYAEGEPLVAGADARRAGPYDYPHSGYAWAWTRDALDGVGGLLDIGGMGAGDHHMALAIAGLAERSMPGGTHPAYAAHVLRWQARARAHLAGRLGAVAGTIEHAFHGRKADRRYQPRWGMFVEHGFDPDEDLKRNSHGVVEFAGNKPELERDFARYLRGRREDVNSLA